MADPDYLVDVLAPRMPNGSNAQYDEWSIMFEHILPLLSPGTLFVGHSLGGIFLVKYLEEHAIPLAVGATLLVATPYRDTQEDSLASFAPPSSLARFSAQAGPIFLYHSKDDPVVPFRDAEEYYRKIPHAILRALDGYGHFNTASFPEIVEDIRHILASPKIA